MDVKEALQMMLQRLESIEVGCRSCAEFSGVRCNKYDAIPPAETIAKGCDEWEVDGCPF